jgi:hypothetical protein
MICELCCITMQDPTAAAEQKTDVPDSPGTCPQGECLSKHVCWCGRAIGLLFIAVSLRVVQ